MIEKFIGLENSCQFGYLCLSCQKLNMLKTCNLHCATDSNTFLRFIIVLFIYMIYCICRTYRRSMIVQFVLISVKTEVEDTIVCGIVDKGALWKEIHENPQG